MGTKITNCIECAYQQYATCRRKAPVKARIITRIGGSESAYMEYVSVEEHRWPSVNLERGGCGEGEVIGNIEGKDETST
jgi:expansin (peptidoglycan-binding protein)